MDQTWSITLPAIGSRVSLDEVTERRLRLRTKQCWPTSNSYHDLLLGRSFVRMVNFHGVPSKRQFKTYFLICFLMSPPHSPSIDYK